jgi:hypothetical protein
MKTLCNTLLTQLIYVAIFSLSYNQIIAKNEYSQIEKKYFGESEYETYIVQIANKVYLKWKTNALKKTVIIVDFSKPMEQNRLFVVDIKTGKIVLKSKVCHGVGSGNTSIPSKFSNNEGSKMSSKGVMVTAETYFGYFGYSMCIDGLQKNKNSNARKRLIVFHDSAKLSTKWSWGCFSTPSEVNNKLIKLTNKGSLIFAFAEQKDIADI